MKKLCLAGLLLISCGCSSMNNTEKGMLGGAAAGTGAGALIGRGNPAAMAVGAIAGTMIGGIAGSNQDAREDRKAAHAAAVNAAQAQAARQMSLGEIVELSQRPTPDHIIIQQIANTGSTFALTSADIGYLQDQRVSPSVISYMQQARRTVVVPSRTVVVREPVYVVPPPPPPPVYVEPGFSVGVRGRF